MTKIEVLERELNYQLRVYKGKTEKYQKIKKELSLYKNIYYIIYMRTQIKMNADHWYRRFAFSWYN